MYILCLSSRLSSTARLGALWFCLLDGVYEMTSSYLGIKLRSDGWENGHVLFRKFCITGGDCGGVHSSMNGLITSIWLLFDWYLTAIWLLITVEMFRYTVYVYLLLIQMEIANTDFVSHYLQLMIMMISLWWWFQTAVRLFPNKRNLPMGKVCQYKKINLICAIAICELVIPKSLIYLSTIVFAFRAFPGG